MNFGNLSGLVNGTSQVAFYRVVTGVAVTSIDTGAIFNGDEDGWFDIIARPIYDTADSTLNMYFNADNTSANYGYRGITAANTTVANINSTASLVRMASVASGSTSGFSVLRLYAKQGAVRLINGVNVCNINATTVTQIETLGSVYSVTNTNITGFVFAPSAGKLGIGTEIIVIKSNNFTDGTPCGTITTPYIKGAWVRVGSEILADAAASVTFPNLDGNTAVLYYLSYKAKNGYNGTNAYALRLNTDSGNNYGSQRLSGVSTTVAASRDVVANLGQSAAGLALNDYCIQSCLIFAKSGFIRPAIVNIARGISTTTVTGLYTEGCSWNNTADNITSLAITGLGGNIAAGSQFDLYALYK